MRLPELQKELRRDPRYLVACFIFWVDLQLCKIFGHKWELDQWDDDKYLCCKRCCDMKDIVD